MSIRFRLAALAAAGLALGALTAEAQSPQPLTLVGDPQRGETLAYTCSGCHGVPGAVNAYPTYHVPKLGGQNADYIEVALQGYRAGQRPHPTMQGQATELSDQDVADVAAYLSGIEHAPQTGVYSASAAELAAGESKSTTCQGCHGADGMAPSPQWPNLAGQHESYLVHAIHEYKDGERKDPIMGGQVSQLDDETIEQIAAFYSAKPGLFQTDN